MKTTESENFKYTQKNIVVGDRMRSVIVIDKKPGAKLTQSASSTTSAKIISGKNNIKTAPTIKKKTCGGCGRKRRK